ncbi:hypothetical protein D3C80_1630640 [compost metagenome]
MRIDEPGRNELAFNINKCRIRSNQVSGVANQQNALSLYCHISDIYFTCDYINNVAALQDCIGKLPLVQQNVDQTTIFHRFF